jgi:DNA-binding NarL/FixJ family response regulator
LSRPRILLADDHPAVLKATNGLLKAQFDVVGTVVDGATLVSEALRLCPDVIVADITLPVLSGIDAARQLRDSASSAKIVFLTVHSEQQFVDACMAEGALGYVHKSYYEGSLDSSDTSSPCGTILRRSIRSHKISVRPDKA